MLTAARLREYTGESGALALLRELGYPVAPVDVDPVEWRRGGVTIPWNGEARLRLIARLRRFDLFLLAGNVREESITEFMRSYRDYNVLTKSAVIYCSDEALSIFDLSPERTLRRLDVDLARPSAHAIDRLNLLARGEEDALPRIFDRALDREQVTREFFQRFRAAVNDVAAALAAALPREERTAVDGQALLILSRLLFLSFVQEKGWLGGERRFLVDRLEHEIRRGREFFHGILLPLFFGCLNTPLHSRSLAARKLGRVPYLNGGLFEPSPFELRNPELHLPNELMQRVLEEVFEKFDFRIDEHDSAGTHVDPEMLGRVFESLMAAGERAASGSFYTPREIVDVLTERAITEWLGDGGIEKLETITVLDPACGSGAFLLSAMGVIERIWKRLAGAVPPDLRRRIVANCLYGVDLKPEAVRLCELRLWLAIVSGSDASIERVEPCRTWTATSSRAIPSSAPPTFSATDGWTSIATGSVRCARSRIWWSAIARRRMAIAPRWRGSFAATISAWRRSSCHAASTRPRRSCSSPVRRSAISSAARRPSMRSAARSSGDASPKRKGCWRRWRKERSISFPSTFTSLR